MLQTNFANRTLYHGDNLDFLRGMNSGTVHLIATDPPFNKGKDFHATPDSLAAGAKFQDRWSWADDVEGEWIDQIQDDWPAVWEVIDAARAAWGDDMAAFLCFMGVRLIETRRVLRDDGSLYLHCDPTASHYLKALLDAVFGRRQFRNEVIWCYKSGGRAKVHFPKKHDVILWYSKSHRDYIFNYDAVSIPRDTSTMHEPVLTDEAGRRYQRNIKNGKEYRYYLDKGVLPDDWWTDIQAENPASKKRTGYPTQKPLPLYERIIQASSNSGDVVLDPFAGCATTLVAAGAPGPPVGRHGHLGWRGGHRAPTARRQPPATDRRRPRRSTTQPSRPCARTTARTRCRSSRSRSAMPSRAASAEPSRVYDYLLRQHGPKCQGCDRTFDDPRYLELDHNTPRSDGGMNHITNRILLCGPCNRLKSNQYTLSGLRRQNGKLGYMACGHSGI